MGKFGRGVAEEWSEVVGGANAGGGREADDGVEQRIAIYYFQNIFYVVNFLYCTIVSCINVSYCTLH